MSQIQLIPRAALEKMSWWSELSASEQRIVLVEAQGLNEEMFKHGVSKLAIGEHLLKIQEVLEPKRKFTKFLKSQFRSVSPATAYRYIQNYTTTKDRLPEIVVQTAMTQGYHVIDMDMVEKMPPPRTQDRTKIIAYLDRLRLEKKVLSKEEGTEDDPRTMARECFNFICSRLDRLPNNSRSRINWLYSLFGMLMTQLGIGEEQSVTPADIPEGFRAIRGRPRIVA